MLAVTFFETVVRDLILGECLSVWKENNENPVRLMTGSCALCFINIIVKYASMWSKHVYWGQNLFIAWNFKQFSSSANGTICLLSLFICCYCSNLNMSIFVVKNRLFYSKQSLRKFCFIFDVLFINGGCANNRGYQILTLYSNLLIFCLIMRKSFSVILLNNQVNCLFRCRQKGVSWENIWQISAEKKQHKIQKMCRFWHFDDRNSGSLSVGIFRFLF